MNREMTEAELAEIQHKLDTAYCNPVWRKHVTSLTAEVIRLRKLLATVERVIAASDNLERFDFESDTIVL